MMQCACQSVDVGTWVSIILSILALVIAVYIPIQIMKFQRYTNLTSDYMSFNFAHAFQMVIDFYYRTCDCDIEKIPEEYYKRYKSDFQKLRNGDINIENVLHYQRRFLNIYFLELEFCRESSFTLRKMIKMNWTKSEAYVVKILMYMNKAVDENPEIFMDISSIKHERIPKAKGLNIYLARLQNELKDSNRWMKP